LIVICNGLQAVFGSITYAVQHESITEDGFMAHDESLILNLILFVGLMAGTLLSALPVKNAPVCRSVLSRAGTGLRSIRASS